MTAAGEAEMPEGEGRRIAVNDVTAAGEADSSKQLFPLLKTVFEEVPLNIGFNIEIKYCMRLNVRGQST